MFISRIALLSGLIFSTVFLLPPAYANNVEQSESSTEKNVNLHFYPSSVKPACSEASRHFLIVNKAGYYNSVFANCAEKGGFIDFWGWDNGEYTIFATNMYAWWAELPEKI